MSIRIRNDEEHFGLELTPLIDVVFLLIIFFLVATTFQQLEREIAVSVPESETGKETRAEPVVVNVLKDGSDYKLIVEGNTLSIDQLQSFISFRVEQDPGTGALVRADGRLFHQQVVRVTEFSNRLRVG